MRVLRELLNVNPATTDVKLFEMAAKHQNIPESDARARVDYGTYRETGYPPAYVEGAFTDLVKAANARRQK